jgi:hypothetical protein
MSDNPWVSREASERITREIEEEDRELADKKRKGEIVQYNWHSQDQQPLTEDKD